MNQKLITLTIYFMQKYIPIIKKSKPVIRLSHNSTVVSLLKKFPAKREEQEMINENSKTGSAVPTP